MFIMTVAVVANAEPRRSDTINLRTPLDIPLLLSGNFGELRRNHFHSGIDFKTQGKTGLPVFAVDDGFVSRVSVSPWGFGKAVYITHPVTGLTTVYGHLESFSPDIDRLVKARQYNDETFSVDISFEPDRLPVKKGAVIARSGNSGSSGGPHLHFDIRDTESGDPLDPLEYFHSQIKDTAPPEVRELALYPINGGIVNGTSEKGTYLQPTAKKEFTGWGWVIPGIKAYDRMSGTSNIYGIKYLTLLLENDTIYHRKIDRFSFDDTRAVHTLVNYPDLVDKSAWFMTTRIAQSDPLPYMVTAKNHGIINIDSEKPYHLTWILADEYGNTSRCPFTIIGKRELTSSPIAHGQLALRDADNSIEDREVYIEIPAGALYDNEFIDFKTYTDDKYLSKVISIGNTGIPLARSFTISIPIDKDTLENKNQYCLVRLSPSGITAEESVYSDGSIDASISRFGSFAVSSDTKPPIISPIGKEKWKSSNIIKYKISDNLSGIKSWEGRVDGKWALFELDGKTGILSFRLDSNRFPGKSHTIELRVTDACGNIGSIRDKL